MEKKKALWTFSLFLIGAVIAIICSCSKDIKIELPQLSTVVTTEITSVSATSGGNITNDGGAEVISRGVCWSTNQEPTTADNKTVDGKGGGIFSSSLTGLLPATTYYVKAYAVNSMGTSYGKLIQFLTLSQLPLFTMNTVMVVKDTMATCGALITADGGATVTSRGVCWSKNQEPTIADNKTSDGTGIGSYTSTITGLSPGTTYYARAYATNSVGTAYSAQMTISTITTTPSLTTISATEIGEREATSGGNITIDGGASVISRGVCWSTTQNPTVDNSKTSDGTGIGSYTSSLTGLEPGKLYYIRAYAENTSGIAYGNQISITTKVAIPILTTTEISAITSSSASSGGIINSNGGGEITAKGVCWSTSVNPSIVNQKRDAGSGSGNFTGLIDNLISGETYYVRAFASNSAGTGYGIQLQFKTIAGFPVLSTNKPSVITQSGALTGGNITSEGSSPLLFRGVCWSNTPNPTILNNNSVDASGSALFTSTITGLDYGTKYWVRAYAVNSLGASYGNEFTFTTLPRLPILTTSTVSAITKNSAISGGIIIDNGRGEITASGICWSINPNPTVTDNRTLSESGELNFGGTMNYLKQATTYYVRAYATNAGGTAYGNQITFTTYSALPTVTTTDVTEITTTSALCGGELLSSGEGSVSFHGLCWSTTPFPTVSDERTSHGPLSGSFKSRITGLTLGTTYYVRAYATNENGTSYGNQKTFTTYNAWVSDVDGNRYHFVTIGTQIWMTENLRTTRYSNGDLIGTTLPATLDISAQTAPKYQWAYDGDESIAAVYGRLYTWYAAIDSRNICPSGWHVPSFTEWETLINYLGGYDNSSTTDKLREVGTTHWNSNFPQTNNSSGFTALPNGFRKKTGEFTLLGIMGSSLSSGEWPYDNALGMSGLNLTIHNNYLSKGGFEKGGGSGVRCIKSK
jgi:uncharacterized protein (TIGR02145 family)